MVRGVRIWLSSKQLWQFGKQFRKSTLRVFLYEEEKSSGPCSIFIVDGVNFWYKVLYLFFLVKDILLIFSHNLTALNNIVYYVILLEDRIKVLAVVILSEGSRVQHISCLFLFPCFMGSSCIFKLSNIVFSDLSPAITSLSEWLQQQKFLILMTHD